MKRYTMLNIFVSTDGTTGQYLGRAARGGVTVPRAYTIVSARANLYNTGTTTNQKFKMMAYKNKTTTICSFLSGSATRKCTTTGFKSYPATALTAPSLSTSNRIWFDITNHVDGQKKISVTLQLQEA